MTQPENDLSTLHEQMLEAVDRARRFDEVSHYIRAMGRVPFLEQLDGMNEMIVQYLDTSFILLQEDGLTAVEYNADPLVVSNREEDLSVAVIDRYTLSPEYDLVVYTPDNTMIDVTQINRFVREP